MIQNNEATNEPAADGTSPEANGAPESGTTDSTPSAPASDSTPNGVTEDNNMKGDFDGDVRLGKEIASQMAERTKSWFQNNGGDLMALLIASLLLLVKASADLAKMFNLSSKEERQLGFAISVGVISLIITGGFMFAKKKEKVMPKHELVFVCFQFVWWALAVCVLTFGTIYNQTGNGYFATWGGFYFAASLFQKKITQTSDYLRRFRSLGFHLGALFIASVVIFFASLGPCGQDCKGSNGFALSVGIISFLVLLLFVFLGNSMPPKAKSFIGVFFIIWWALAVFICTFISPFTNTGNGYFACWVGLMASAMMYNHLKQDAMIPEDEPDHLDMV